MSDNKLLIDTLRNIGIKYFYDGKYSNEKQGVEPFIKYTYFNI